MNTFILSTDPTEAARFHCNKHVVKMILESAQMLCAAHWIHLLASKGKSIDDFKTMRAAQAWAYENFDKSVQPPWKMSHLRHPCTKWTSENASNYGWQMRLCRSLLDEYRRRYAPKTHKTEHEYKWLAKNYPLNIKDDPLSNFPVCMKEDFKIYNNDGTLDVVKSYRNYYIKDKSRFAKWEPRTKEPQWYQEGIKKWNVKI